VSPDELEEMGPIDYVLIAWPDPHPNGELAPLLVDLVDRGIIRILDLAFVAKGEDGTVGGLELADVGDQVQELKVFEGASSGLLSDDDLEEAGAALDPGSAAAVLVFENRWAAPFATAVRRSGGQLVANGRIPIQALLAALDAAEEAESATAS
jgi:dihydroorotase-like cyclic amidohydrolase